MQGVFAAFKLHRAGRTCRQSSYIDSRLVACTQPACKKSWRQFSSSTTADPGFTSNDGPRDAGRKRLILLDGHAMLFRFHFAYGGVLSTSSGENTSIEYGFLKQLLRLLSIDPAPTHMVVVFDAPGKNFRHELFPGYKEQRPPMPKEIRAAIPSILLILDLLKIPVLRVHGVEADDVIGTLAVKAANEGSYTAIVSSDKDFYQLLREGVQLLRAVKRKFPEDPDTDRQFMAGLLAFTADSFEKEYGVKPSQWRYIRALSGDKSDGLPGVPGIGDKGALDLIKEYGDLENLIQNASKLKRKNHREQLSSEDGKATAWLGLELVTIQTDLDLPPLRASLSEYALRSLTDEEQSKVLERCKELQFDNLAGAIKETWKRARHLSN